MPQPTSVAVGGPAQTVTTMTTPHDLPDLPDRGLFVVVEGGDGAGKSTQIAMLADHLDAYVTEEPGGCPLGDDLRELLLHGADIDPLAEALLYAANRAEHVATIVVPMLREGRNVICSRFTWSSLAYQGIGRGLGVDVIAQIDAIARRGVSPDATILLDVDATTAAARTVGRGEPDRMERAGADFHAQVRDAYLGFATADPTAVIVDASAAPADVHDQIVAGLRRLTEPLDTAA